MLRKIGIGFAAMLLLAGCGQRAPSNALVYGGLPMSLRAPAGEDNQVFSYTHMLSLLLPHGGVKQSFEKARDACLHDAALGCKLIAANINTGLSADEASLSVALPHDKVAVFEKMLTQGDVTVQSRTTSAENVTTQAADNERKVAQLTAYRDRLAALLKRSAISVADLMKVEAELSKVEADLGAALAEKRDVSERIARELLTVSFSEREAAMAPIARAFSNAGDTLTQSTANAVEFLIQIVPWLPIVLGGLWLLRWLWTRRKKAA